MTVDPAEDLKALAGTVETFYADATRFRDAVEQYERGNLSERRVEAAYDRAEERMREADDAITTLLEAYATGRLDAAMREPHEEREEARSAAALAEHVDETYLDAVDAYYDARHAYLRE